MERESADERVPHVFGVKRSTVSEFRVLEVATNSVVIQIAEGSDYAIGNGKVSWTGDIGTGEGLGNRNVRLTWKDTY